MWDFHLKIITVFIVLIMGVIFDVQETSQSMFLIFILLEILNYKKEIELKEKEQKLEV